ncbi:class I SAM-dependent methyltransferase [Dactylosporangium aurantiacum]|uniref:Class I SAM-dependent methyltransferase n=1 Tax=Dactylosporangium aurantiacum TaxID=35754 RepID=A0A9Q9I758_9ACTN|nr:class I SAM-dependent methyltransferase [Dactylosporangium aurantiacum]MDG6106767.1 class I SAM-dependent methyltransferase [Dactylosporangium aurantiacum]UWZ50909.1 class I SAM-dependent methyltransferase [Dactylosporangium aurantiacum]
MTSLADAPVRADTALLRLGDALKDAGYAFTAVTPATYERVNGRPGNARGRALRDVLGWSRPFGPGDLPDRFVTLLDEAGVLHRDGDLWRATVRCSSYDGGLFFHSAYPPNAPDAVFFGPDTYRTADAVAGHLRTQDRPPRRAVDIGTGSGAVAVTVARHAPHAEVLAVDINPAALRFAAVNATLAGCGDRVRAVRSDLLSAVDGTFDLIVSNPPFMIDPDRRPYRHGGGEHGHDLPLAVLDTAVQRLTPGGSLVLFSGTGIVDGHDPLLAAADERLAGTDLRWSYREVDPDVYSENLDDSYAHAERIAVAVLTATRAA